MKANLARFTVALALLATMALTSWRGSQVVLAMNIMFVAALPDPRSDATRPGPCAGHRWS